jgi:AAA15 family ATPase/GTPase
MLIQFTVGNFLSFKDKATLSMVKTAMHDLPESTIEAPGQLELLKSAVVYGANASGKSNLIFALSFMKFFAINSFRAYQPGDDIGLFSFQLNEASKDRPCFLEAVFLLDDVVYRYGFEFDNKRVSREWLHHSVKNEEKALFIRDGLNFETISPEDLDLFMYADDADEVCRILKKYRGMNGLEMPDCTGE